MEAVKTSPFSFSWEEKIELEAKQVIESFDEYAKKVIEIPVDDTFEAHRTAMIQTMLKIQMLRITASQLMVQFFQLPPSTSVLKTEEFFLKKLIDTEGKEY